MRSDLSFSSVYILIIKEFLLLSTFFDDFVQSFKTSLASLFASKLLGSVEPSITTHAHTSFDFKFKSGAHGKEAIHGDLIRGVEGESGVLHTLMIMEFLLLTSPMVAGTTVTVVALI